MDEERGIDPAVSAFFRALAVKRNRKLGKKGRAAAASHAAETRWSRLSKEERKKEMKRRRELGRKRKRVKEKADAES